MNRVYWADFLLELPDIIPPTVDLVALTADYQFVVPDEEEGEDEEESGKNRSASMDENARFFEIELKAPLAGIGSSIPELTQITAGLAASDNFSRYFREIPAPDINPMEIDGAWQANIVLRCTP